MSLTSLTRRICLVLPVLCGSLTMAGVVAVTPAQTVIESEASFRLWFQLQDVWPQPEVDFVVLNNRGEVLGQVQGGAVRSMINGYIYDAPRTALTQHLTIQATFRDTARSVGRCQITVQGTTRSGPAEGEGEGKLETPPARSSVWGDCELPGDIRSVVEGYLDQPEASIRSSQWPFYNLESKVRFTEGVKHGPGPELILGQDGLPKCLVPGLSYTLPCYSPSYMNHVFGRYAVAAFGRPYPISFAPKAKDSGAGLCSYRDPYLDPTAQVTWRELNQGPAATLTFRGNVTSFTFEQLDWSAMDSRWWSRLNREEIQVRGMSGLAGVWDQPAIRSGQGIQARLRPPTSLAYADYVGWNLEGGEPKEPYPHGESGTIFTEAGSSAIRFAREDGGVRTLCGEPEEPGFMDGASPSARFNNPSYVCVGGSLDHNRHGWFAYVSDTGNKAIRQINLATSKVATIGAGAVLRPMGLCHDNYGLIVADAGHRTVVRMSAGGRISPLAGTADVQGTVDGLGGAAQFHSLRGLASDGGHPHPTFYVLDGNAVRSIDHQGRVLTLAGSVLDEGFQDFPDGHLPGGSPCFSLPCGIAHLDKCLYIADTGNHAIRKLDLRTLALTTLAGDPKADTTCFGLLRDGLAELPAEGYASLTAPRALTINPFSRDYNVNKACLIAGTGSSLVILPAVTNRAPADLPVLSFVPRDTPPGVGAPWSLGFNLEVASIGKPSNDGFGRSLIELPPYDFEYAVECFDPEGSLIGGQSIPGKGIVGIPTRVVCPPFDIAGACSVRVRCVTTDGYSVAASQVVTALATAPASETTRTEGKEELKAQS